MKPEEITAVRVDLPRASGSSVYFFIRSDDERRTHPWWGELLRFLFALQPRISDGVHLESGKPMEVAMIKGAARPAFLRLLQSAPEHERSEHLTLRAALRILPESELDVPVRFFGTEPKASQFMANPLPPGGTEARETWEAKCRELDHVAVLDAALRVLRSSPSSQDHEVALAALRLKGFEVVASGELWDLEYQVRGDPLEQPEIVKPIRPPE